jgi:hypothetical protein
VSNVLFACVAKVNCTKTNIASASSTGLQNKTINGEPGSLGRTGSGSALMM